MYQRIFRRRVFISGFVLTVIVSLFIVKLITLHFSEKIILDNSRSLPLRRGYIKDANGTILALSVESRSLFANPQLIQEPEKTAGLLAEVLDVDQNTIEMRLKSDRKFVWIKRKLDEHLVSRITELKIKGLFFKKEFERVYPYTNLASNLLGFVGIDNNGLGGIEYKYDAVLSGKKDIRNKSNKLEYLSTGYHLVLTIDKNIQFVAEQEIKKGVESSRAKQGIVLVMETATGKILALGKYPNFDPNKYNRYSQFERRNFTVIDSFEPGSTLKVLSLVAISRYNPDALRKQYICKGSVDIGDVTINCSHAHGTVEMSDIISKSCNVGIIKSMRGVKRKELYQTLKSFHIGDRIGIGLPGETSGILRDTKEWSGLSKYSIAIGHELSVTSIQLTAAFSAIANGGVYVKPYIIDAIESPDETVLEKRDNTSNERILTRETSRYLMKMMKGVVDEGTGTAAASYYFNIVGKTGTSQKYFIKKGEYTDSVISSFIGIVPYEKPRLCILVVIDDSEYKQSGGMIAAPVFKNIADAIMPYYGSRETVYRARLPLKSNDPLNKNNLELMPDIRGIRLPGAIRTLNDYQKYHGIVFSISGEGRVYAQKPLPGERLKKNQKVILQLR